MAHKQCVDKVDKRCDCIKDDLEELETLKKNSIKSPEFIGFRKIPRLNREMIITEKIDGTNGAIYIDENNNIFVGSKNRWLDEHNENHGFWH
jgi:hypothetical protein